MANERYVEYFDEKISTLFENKSVTQHFLETDEAGHEQMLSSVLSDEGYPEHVDANQINHDVIIEPGINTSEFAEQYVDAYSIDNDEEFEALKDDDRNLLAFLLEDYSMLNVEISLNETKEEAWDRFPDAKYLEEKIQDEWDELALREYIESTSDFEDEVRQEGADEGFLVTTPLEDYDASADNIEPKTSYSAIADYLMEYVESYGSVTELMNAPEYISMLVDENLVKYSVTINAEPDEDMVGRINDFAELIEENFKRDGSTMELIKRYAPDYHERMKEGMDSEGYPEHVNVDDMSVGFADIEPDPDFETLANEYMNTITEDYTFEDFVNDDMMERLVTDGHVSYEIEIYSEPEDFQE